MATTCGTTGCWGRASTTRTVRGWDGRPTVRRACPSCAADIDAGTRPTPPTSAAHGMAGALSTLPEVEARRARHAAEPPPPPVSPRGRRKWRPEVATSNTTRALAYCIDHGVPEAGHHRGAAALALGLTVQTLGSALSQLRRYGVIDGDTVLPSAGAELRYRLTGETRRDETR